MSLQTREEFREKVFKRNNNLRRLILQAQLLFCARQLSLFQAWGKANQVKA
jgi:hypothetical protein